MSSEGRRRFDAAFPGWRGPVARALVSVPTWLAVNRLPGASLSFAVVRPLVLAVAVRP